MERYFTADPRFPGDCRVIATISTPGQAGDAVERGADVVELRLDQVRGDPAETAAAVREIAGTLPLILTLRSIEEGGAFAGGPGEWYALVRTAMQHADIVDCEGRYREYARMIRVAGREVIASLHSTLMPSSSTLDEIDRDLRTFGDIAKIIVTPRTPCDAASLVAFTARAGRPVITGVMGSGFRHLRAFLPFFGSAAVYCHVGTLMSEGQYEVGEMISLLSLLGGKGAPRMTGPRRVRDYPEK